MPKLFREKYRIESTRLQNWDYSSDGFYFVTICTKNMVFWFGDIVDGRMKLNEFGRVVDGCFYNIPKYFPFVILDEFVIMPNHVHGIIRIDNNYNVETGLKPVSTKKYPVSEMVRAFKTFSARRINPIIDSVGLPFWQARYYDRVIRSQEQLERIRWYIRNNPRKWEDDRNYLENLL